MHEHERDKSFQWNRVTCKLIINNCKSKFFSKLSFKKHLSLHVSFLVSATFLIADNSVVINFFLSFYFNELWLCVKMIYPYFSNENNKSVDLTIRCFKLLFFFFFSFSIFFYQDCLSFYFNELTRTRDYHFVPRGNLKSKFSHSGTIEMSNVVPWYWHKILFYSNCRNIEIN